MKALLLVVCSVIAVSQAGLFNDREEKLENVLNDLEVVLQDLQETESDDESSPESEMLNEDKEAIMEDEFEAEDRVRGEIVSVENEFEAEDTVKGELVNTDSAEDTGSQEDSEVLLHATDIKSATAQIEAAGGRVTMQLGHDLLVAQWPGDVTLAQTNFASASAHIPSSASEATLSNAEAYWKMRADKLKPQPEYRQWSDGTPPEALQQLPEDESESYLDLVAEASPYSKTMTGKIVVIVIGVSGPGKTRMKRSEWTKVISEVYTGLDFWTDKAPKSARLSFVVFSGLAYIRKSNPKSCSSHSACHNVFGDAALKSFGYSKGLADRKKMAQDFKDIAGADGAYMAFFSKYRQKHFAYAYFGGGPVYMQYGNDGWGPNRIDRIFAHETGHVFNAPDEYTNCKCSKNYGRGSCTAKNKNCQKKKSTSCTSKQSKCIMDGSDFSLCPYTKKHIGWC